MTDDEYCMHELAPGTCSICKRQPAPASYRRPTTAPKTADDPIAPLSGTKDISISMYETEPYVGTDWLVTWGYPHDLRPNGWVYLRVGPKLAARARVVDMRWRDDRPFGIPGESESIGPGLVFGLDPHLVGAVRSGPRRRRRTHAPSLPLPPHSQRRRLPRRRRRPPPRRRLGRLMGAGAVGWALRSDRPLVTNVCGS